MPSPAEGLQIDRIERLPGLGIELPGAQIFRLITAVGAFIVFCLAASEAGAEDAKTVKYPSGNTLSLVSWGADKNYKGCGKLNPLNDKQHSRISKGCYFYAPGIGGGPLVRIQGNEEVRLANSWAAWELGKVDPSDKRNGVVNPDYTYEYCRKGSSGGKECHILYKVARIDPDLVKTIQEIREAVGFPIYMDEAYRAFGHNLDMYRKSCAGVKRNASEYARCVKEGSRHTKGVAVDLDLRRTDKARRQACGDSKFNGSRRGKEVCKIRGPKELGRHLKRKAFEILKRNGGGGIGLGPTAMHVDVARRRSRKGGVATWKY